MALLRKFTPFRYLDRRKAKKKEKKKERVDSDDEQAVHYESVGVGEQAERPPEFLRLKHLGGGHKRSTVTLVSAPASQQMEALRQRVSGSYETKTDQ